MSTTRDFTLSGSVTLSDDDISAIIEMAGYVQHGWNAGGQFDDVKRTFTLNLEPDCEVRGKRKYTISYDRIADAFVTLATEKEPRPAILHHLLLLASGDEYGSSEMDAIEYDCIVQQALFGEIIFG
jgi:hypothetical protein